ncbi:hypothetical protein MP228_009235 [Amoeboaphelidium protococcarum]|nr:hypothetical protein MP228_009235 [Amoeboaphelidium protococcarum]
MIEYGKNKERDAHGDQKCRLMVQTNQKNGVQFFTRVSPTSPKAKNPLRRIATVDDKASDALNTNSNRNHHQVRREQTGETARQEQQYLQQDSAFRSMMIFKHPSNELMLYHKYLSRKEHSEENLEFCLALRNHNLLYKRYKKQKAILHREESGSIVSASSDNTCSSADLSKAYKSLESIIVPSHSETISQMVNNDIITSMQIDRRILRHSVKLIYATYLATGAGKQVNIPNRLKQKIVKCIDEDKRYDSMIFVECREYVFELMRKDSYSRFLKLYLNSNN